MEVLMGISGLNSWTVWIGALTVVAWHLRPLERS